MLTGRRLVVAFVGLQLGMILSTIDGTIVATALPSIDRDLGGLSRLSWVITAYFLAQVAALPLMGKLGDLYGRRRLFFVALTLFTTGSMLCGLAQSIDQLIVFRAVQGLGGSAWAPWRWRSSPTSSPPGSSRAGSAIRARSSRCRASSDRSPVASSSTS